MKYLTSKIDEAGNIDAKLKPAASIRNEHYYTNYDVALTIANEICTETNAYFTRRTKMNRDDLNKAKEQVESATAKLTGAIDQLTSKINELSEKTKTISSKTRDTAQKLNEGLIKIEKQADFTKLEQRVELLERAGKALNALAKLEQNGSLQKITQSLK